MNGTPSLPVISFSLPATSIWSSRDSTTHGPAMRNSGRVRPTSNPQSFMLLRPTSGSCRDHREWTLFPRTMAQGGRDVSLEQRMAPARRGGELGVELHADEERVSGQLHDLGEVLGRGARRHPVAFCVELRHVDVVHLVAVTVPLVHLGAIDRKSQGILFDRTLLRAQAHGPAELRLLGALLDAAGAVEPLGDERDHWMRRVVVELGAVRAGEAADVARELDSGELHAEADAEIRHAVLARVADRGDLALGAALAEAAGDQDRVHLLQAAATVLFQLFGIEVMDVDLRPGMDAGVAQRLVQALVRILQVDVFADERDVDLVLRVLLRV